MAGRRLVVAASLLVSAVGLTGLLATDGARSATRASTPAVYRLQPDARMCPSPACGGFWARRVNRTLTTCLDGSSRRSCYVATVDLAALPAGARSRARAALGAAPTTLVTGSFARYRNKSFPRLARLVATRVWVAAGPSRATPTVYRVVDTGLRCIRAPCYSLRATPVNARASSSLSGLDLSHAGGSAAELGAARSALARTGVLAAGTIRPGPVKPGVPDGGRVLVATQFWLPA
jgi:hypothetical protein